jgi:hypothetical protein
MGLAIHHVERFTGHLADAIDVDRFQDMCFLEGKFFRPSICLTRSGINNAGFTIFTTAGFENGKRSNGIQMQILKRLLHGLDMTDMAGEVEDELFPLHQLPHQIEVATIAFDNFNILLDRSDIEIVAPTGWMHRIEKSYGGTGSDEANSEIASDEAETAGD